MPLIQERAQALQARRLELERELQDIDLRLSNLAEELNDLASLQIETREESRRRHWAMRQAAEGRGLLRLVHSALEPISLAVEHARRAVEARNRELAEQQVEAGEYVGIEAAEAALTATEDQAAADAFMESVVEEKRAA